MKTFSVFGVETKKELTLPDVAHDTLVDKDLIHNEFTKILDKV